MLHFKAILKTSGRSYATLEFSTFFFFFSLDPDFVREQYQKQELFAPLRAQMRHMKFPHKEQKVVAEFQARGTAFSCHFSDTNIKIMQSKCKGFLMMT